MEELPRYKSDWMKHAKRLNCDKTIIHELDREFVTSASKIGDKQYLTLRVLWNEKSNLDCPIPFKNKDKLRKEALDFLETHKAWQRYWEDFHQESNDIDNTGALYFVRRYQKASYRDPNDKVTRDELRQLRKKVSPMSRRHVLRPGTFRSKSYAEDDGDSDSQDTEDENSDEELIVATGQMTIDERHTPANSNMPFVATPQTPALRASSSPAEDEVIVNTALVLFLQGLGNWHPNLRLTDDDDVPDWTMKRLELHFNIGEDGDDKSMEDISKRGTKRKGKGKGNKKGVLGSKKSWKARTDGFLRVGTKAVIIIEVKPHLRTTCIAIIQKQEAAQMVAWIRACPNDHYECEEKGRKVKRYNLRKSFLLRLLFTNEFRRLLISQDSHEIYITIGEYGEQYEEYLRTSKPTAQKNPTEPSFLTMRQYGPWKTNVERQTKQVAMLLLACTLSEIPVDSEDQGNLGDPFVS